MIADGDAKSLPTADQDPDLLRSLDDLDKKVKAQEQEARALKSYFEDQQALLASAPSIWPVRGWVTSDFSVRLDPYTGERVMHEGIDVAAGLGTPVRAPSDGTVVFSGLEGGYGHVLVIDHGYGLKTRYGHLSRIDVKVGEKVKRGQFVAAIHVGHGRFLLEPGELKRLFSDWNILHYREGESPDSAHRHPTAELIARRC